MVDDNQMRFSLRLALAITMVCAMLIAAVRVETWWAMRVSFTIMFAANLTAICLAIYRRGVSCLPRLAVLWAWRVIERGLGPKRDGSDGLWRKCS